MSAKEMFEELGYKKCQYFTEPNKKLKYYKDDDNVIIFYINMIPEIMNKTFEKTGEYDGMCDGITTEELEAINKQVEELGWNK